MAFFKNVGDELKEFSTLLGLGTSNKIIGFNFRRFGASFGTYEFDAFLDIARKFYNEAMLARPQGTDGYTFVDMQNGKLAIDYNGEIRGIFTKSGKPLAFYRPNFRDQGYSSKQQELDDFRLGHNIAEV